MTYDRHYEPVVQTLCVECCMCRYRMRAAALCSVLIGYAPGAVSQSLASEPESALERFAELDLDKNGFLSREEYAVSEAAGAPEVAARDFAVLDFNHDGSLSVDEFRASLRYRFPVAERGRVPDPMVDFAQRAIEQWQAIFARADSDGNGRLSLQEWPKAELTNSFAVLGESPFSDWDRDRDGQVEFAEGELWFQIGYGLRSADGKQLRSPGATVVSWAYIRGMDRDGNGVVSREEFVSQYWAGKERSPGVFQEIDLDGDGVATFEELSGSPVFALDVMEAFLLADTDLDSFLNTEELVASANRWQKNVALRLVAAFDEDGDTKLSLWEYRTTPIANPGSDWNRRRKDADHDGRLSWKEFYLEKAPSMMGQNWFVFGRFDRNQDGFLGADEFEFDVDRSKVPQAATVEAEFRSQDRNGDGELEFAELFTAASPPEAGETAIRKYRKMRAYHAEWFRIADRDRNGRLTSAEYANSPSKFQPLAFATLMEQDRDGEIGATLDPVLDLMEARLEKVLQVLLLHEADAEGSLPASKWPFLQLAGTTPELAGIPANEWDRNRDGRVTEDECRFILEVAYGVRLPNGQLLRLPVSLVVNWASVSHFDQNGDGVLSNKEYTTRHWGGPVKAAEIFRQLDANGNGQADYQEISTSPVFINDTVRMFFKFDANGDGYLDQRELLTAATKAQQNLALRLLPGFDANADGKLSLHEFRSCPLANQVSDWHRLRKDSDNDGRLSWAEFYIEKSPFLVGLSYEFFGRFDLDHDGYLDSRELEAKVDFNRISPDIAFRIKDRNSDGKLALEEFFAEHSPPESDSNAVERYQLRLASAESRFLARDVDHDGALDLGEFMRAVSNSQSEPAAGGFAPQIGTSRSLWLVPLVFLLHGAALVGLVWHALRRNPRSTQSSKMSEASSPSGERQ